jgi:imidazolonepropionase-like amidohydrolase
MELIHNFIELVDDRAALMARPEIRFANPETLAYWATVNKSTAGPNRLIAYFQAKLIKAFSDARVPLLSGTDTHLVGFVPGFSLHRELQCMAEAGLTPYQVLLSSTATPGRCLNRRTGQIAPGFQADLLLVHANPLSSIAALQDREGVMIRGKWYSQRELDRLMEELVLSYTKN